MRKLRYNVAASLDGFIADVDDRYDWIIEDPTINFKALFAEFDTALMGRRTFELVLSQDTGGVLPGLRTVVCSRTLQASDYPAVTVVNSDVAETVAQMKAEAGKDIWLYGGGSLFRSLLDAGLVDMVEISIIPILLGHGVPLLVAGGRSPQLTLAAHTVRSSGIVQLHYTC